MLLLAITKVSAGMWTNAAGHGIEATLVSLEKDTVTLQQAKGKLFKMKLSGFCATDRKRIRRHFGLKEKPEKPSATDLAYEKQSTRLHRLYVAGKIDDEEFRRQQSLLLEHFYGNKSP
jgi:hypothetical protein